MKSVTSNIYRAKSANTNKNLKFIPSSSIDKFLFPRRWQSESYYAVRYAKSAIICGFCGTGKSMLMNLLVADKNVNGIKTILIAPFKDIVNNSCSEYINLDGKLICVENKSIMDIGDNSNSNELIDFIKSKCITIPENDNVCFVKSGAVCTHSTFTKAINKLSKSERKKYLSNISIQVDECHHSMIKEFSDGTVEYNALSEAIESCREYAESVLMFTATFFRSDNADVSKLPKDTVYYECNIKDHLEDNCKYLEELRIETSFYKGDDFISHIIELIESDPNKPWIVFIPRTGADILTQIGMDKYQVTEEILRRLDEKGIMQDKEKINLVDDRDERKRDKLKKYIKEDNTRFKETGENRISLILTMNMFIEGSDYIPLTNSIVVGHKRSEVFLIQAALGRIGRDAFGKRVATAHIIMSDTYFDFNDYDDILKVETFNKGRIIQSLMLDYNIFDNTIYEKLNDINRRSGDRGGMELLPSFIRKKILENAFEQMAQLRSRFAHSNSQAKQNKFRLILEELFDNYKKEYRLTKRYIDIKIKEMIRLVCYQTLKYENRLGDVYEPNDIKSYFNIDIFGAFDAMIASSIGEASLETYTKTMKKNSFVLDMPKAVMYGVNKKKKEKTK